MAAGRRAESLAALFMLAAETEAVLLRISICDAARFPRKPIGRE